MSSNTTLVLTALCKDTDGVCNVRLYIELAGRHGSFGHVHMTKEKTHVQASTWHLKEVLWGDESR